MNGREEKEAKAYAADARKREALAWRASAEAARWAIDDNARKETFAVYARAYEQLARCYRRVAEAYEAIALHFRLAKEAQGREVARDALAEARGGAPEEPEA